MPPETELKLEVFKRTLDSKSADELKDVVITATLLGIHQESMAVIWHREYRLWRQLTLMWAAIALSAIGALVWVRLNC